MESWAVGYGAGDIERHAGLEGDSGAKGAPLPAGKQGLHLRIVSDYI